MAGAKLPEKWPLLEIKATFIKQTSTDVRAEGELMHRRRFLVWVTDRIRVCCFGARLCVFWCRSALRRPSCYVFL